MICWEVKVVAFVGNVGSIHLAQCCSTSFSLKILYLYSNGCCFDNEQLGLFMVIGLSEGYAAIFG